jgi:putative ABC transport system permease protein
MSLWKRIRNALENSHLNGEIDEELESHIAEAVANGRDPNEARRAFGSPLRHREASRDVRIVTWLDSLRTDAIFGLRQLRKNKATSIAAILSLALAVGSCMAAFRLIDAILLRPLPVANAEHLYEVSRHAVFNNQSFTYDSWAYPSFQQMRAAVKDQAELIAVSDTEPMDLTYQSDQEMERTQVQYVCGWMFPTFGLRPKLGRLFSANDNVQPGAHPYAVLSQGYWEHRFGEDPKIVGRTFRMGNRLYEIVGVVEGKFTGTEPGTMVDIFVPVMMHPGVSANDWTWHRTLAVLRPGAAVESLRAKLEAVSRAFDEQRMNGATAGMPKEELDAFLNQKVLLEPAASGASQLRTDTRRPLTILGVLVVLVLLIACANVANLMTAQASARSREMALRVSIGGGRWRLVQLVLVQSACLAFLAAALGALFAWWAAPFAVGMINPPDNPARLLLPADWRVLGFGLATALGVTLLFGLLPALRASTVNPVSALKGGEDPHARRRLMHSLIGVQVAFCFLVLFVAGLFVTTFERLSHESTGFSADRVLVVETVTKRPQSLEYWNQVMEYLRHIKGIEAVGMSDAPLLGGGTWSNFISVDGLPPNGISAYMRRVSPGWTDTLKIPLADGRDFLPQDADPGSALVNQSFANAYFNGKSPVGRTFEVVFSGNVRVRFQTVGVVGDVRYGDLRQPFLPQVYVPFRMLGEKGEVREVGGAELLVRTTSANPTVLSPLLRDEIPRARPEFRVSRIRTQMEINQSHTVRERLLATLAVFFAVVALLLAGVGLYGVLHYYVVQRQREIGIRIAVGAGAANIARIVTFDAFIVLLVGSAAGLALGVASARFMESLFYQVKATDLGMLLLPGIILFAAALLAAVPAVIRAVHIDPASMLRVE